jgi:hypothetical protein
MIGKLGAGNKGQILENVSLQIGIYSSGIDWLQRLQGLSALKQVILG